MTFVSSVHVRARDARYAQDMRAGKHLVVADEPEALGGADAGPAPYALLLASLGACTSITLRMYADRKGWDLGAVRVDLYLHRDAEKKETITRHLRFGAPLTDEQRTRLLEIAAKTPVTKTLLAGTTIHSEI